MKTIEELLTICKDVRADIVKMTTAAGSGRGCIASIERK
jgi:hypothetical protein